MLFQVAPIGKRLHQIVESLLGLLVPLALQIEAGDFLVVLDILRIDLLQEDFVQNVARNGTRGHPHVPYVRDAFDLRPLRRQRRNALHDVDRSLRRHHREGSVAELVERLNAKRLPDHLDRRAAAGHVLANRELLIDLPVFFGVELAQEPLGEEGATQIIVHHHDVLDAVAAAGLSRRPVGISRRLAQRIGLGMGSVQYAAVFEHVLHAVRLDGDAGASRPYDRLQPDAETLEVPGPHRSLLPCSVLCNRTSLSFTAWGSQAGTLDTDRADQHNWRDW